ncbi:MAG: hypothetical protein ACREQV_15590, partial [Candidatus Binatia bacterium]
SPLSPLGSSLWTSIFIRFLDDAGDLSSQQHHGTTAALEERRMEIETPFFGTASTLAKELGGIDANSGAMEDEKRIEPSIGGQS